MIQIFHLVLKWFFIFGNSSDNEVQEKTYRVHSIHKIKNSSFHIVKISVVLYVLKTYCFNQQFIDMNFMHLLHDIRTEPITKRHNAKGRNSFHIAPKRCGNCEWNLNICNDCMLNHTFYIVSLTYFPGGYVETHYFFLPVTKLCKRWGKYSMVSHTLHVLGTLCKILACFLYCCSVCVKLVCFSASLAFS